MHKRTQQISGISIKVQLKYCGNLAISMETKDCGNQVLWKPIIMATNYYGDQIIMETKYYGNQTIMENSGINQIP